MKINHWHQPEDNYCIPTCQKMVLDYMAQKYTIKNCKPISISTLAKITKTRVIDGTIPKDAENVKNSI